MNKLSKEKKQQLVLTVLVSVIAVAGIWHGLIRAQQTKIEGITSRCDEAKFKLVQVKETVARAKQIEADLAETSAVLANLEETMASGDLYSWAITYLRTFKTPYKLEIPQFSQISGPRDSTLLPNFPYKEASLTISGSGEFHELGRFIADFENKNPFSRLCNLSLEPVPSGQGSDAEKLGFKMDVIALVKPSSSL